MEIDSIIYKNELAKRNYYNYLLNVKGFASESIDSYEKAIWLWEDFTSKADFIIFNKTNAEEFKNWLKTKKKNRSNECVGLSYCYDCLRFLKSFFEWLSNQPGYKSKINKISIDYLNLSRSETKIATQERRLELPTLGEIKLAIEGIIGKTEIDMRDKGLFSLTLLTGARITALSSMPMQCFDKKNLVIDQDPKLGVKTKNSKRITTALIPFTYKEPLNYFLDWYNYLEKEKKFKPNDPIFPSTKIENNDNNFGYYSSGKIAPIFWKNSNAARKIFEKRFKMVGVKYYHPHSFRHLLVKEISKIPLTEEQKKAISQNLGHANVGTTFGSYGYGKINEERQIELIRDIDFESVKRKISVTMTEDEYKKYLNKNDILLAK